MVSNYNEYKLNLTEGQKKKLAKAFQSKYPHTFRMKYEQLSSNFPLLLTKTQIKAIAKAKANKRGLQITISREQMSHQSQSGGFLGALAGLLGRTILPAAARIVLKILSPLGVGALSGLASTGVSKILGNGMISVAPIKRHVITEQKNRTYFIT